jgi:hypothetical protein
MEQRHQHVLFEADHALTLIAFLRPVTSFISKAKVKAVLHLDIHIRW